jgi:hypothetical protein
LYQHLTNSQAGPDGHKITDLAGTDGAWSQKTRLLFPTLYKNQFKMIKALNVRPGTKTTTGKHLKIYTLPLFSG